MPVHLLLVIGVYEMNGPWPPFTTHLLRRAPSGIMWAPLHNEARSPLLPPRLPPGGNTAPVSPGGTQADGLVVKHRSWRPSISHPHQDLPPPAGPPA